MYIKKTNRLGSSTYFLKAYKKDKKKGKNMQKVIMKRNKNKKADADFLWIKVKI